MKTDAHRRAQNKYQAAHYTNISIKVTKEYASAVKAAAAAIHQAPAAIIRQAFNALLLSQNINPATLEPLPPSPPDPSRDDETMYEKLS